MRKSMASLGLLAYLLVSLVSVPHGARAEVFVAASGMQTASGPVCYRWASSPNGAIGAIKNTASSCSSQKFVMPLYWQNFFSSGTSRSIVVLGRRPTSSSTLSCTASVFSGTSGALLSSSSASFAVTSSNGGYGTITLSVTNVTSSTASFVSCTSTGPETQVLKLNYDKTTL